MLRIVGGKYRGKKLFSPENLNVRPTSDRAREAIFNILFSKIGSMEERSVIDVFAGTGALGLEALSRGAKSLCLIDKDITLARKNAALFEKEKDKITLIQADISKLSYSKTKYDLIFSDAPYDKGLNEIALSTLTDKGYIKDGALCVVETRQNEKLDLSKNFELIDERVYGMAKVSFFIFFEKL